MGIDNNKKDYSWIGGAVGAASNVLGSALSSYADYRISEEANQASLDRQREANAFSLDMWNRENAYNHPLAQMKRLQEAGINPSMAYSNGVDGNTTSGAPNSVSPLAAVPSHVSNPFSSLTSDILNIQRAKLESELAKSEGTKRDLMYSEMMVNNGMVVKLSSDVQVNEERKKEIAANVERLNAITPVEIDKIRAHTEQLDSQAALNWTEAYVADKMKDSKIKEAAAKAQLSETEIVRVLANIMNINADTALKGAQTKLFDIQYQNGQLELLINQAKSAVWSDEDNVKLQFYVDLFNELCSGIGSIVSFKFTNSKVRGKGPAKGSSSGSSGSGGYTSSYSN